MSHTEDLVHAGGNGVNGGGATDFVVEFWGELFTASDDFLALFTIWIPSVFFLSAGFLTEGGESDLGEAVFDDFVTGLQLIFFPVAEFFGGLFDSGGDFLNFIIGEREIIDLLPVVFGISVVTLDDGNFDRAEFLAGRLITVILGTLSNEKV